MLNQTIPGCFKKTERIRKEFGKEIEKTFILILQNPDITAEELADKIGKTTRTIEKYIAKLKAAKIIERKGAKLGGYWHIIDES